VSVLAEVGAGGVGEVLVVEQLAGEALAAAGR